MVVSLYVVVDVVVERHSPLSMSFFPDYKPGTSAPTVTAVVVVVDVVRVQPILALTSSLVPKIRQNNLSFKFAPDNIHGVRSRLYKRNSTKKSCHIQLKCRGSVRVFKRYVP